MSNAIIGVNQRFAVKNSGISCLALIFNLRNQGMTILHAKNQFKVAKYDESYTVLFNRSIQTHNFVAKVSHIE